MKKKHIVKFPFYEDQEKKKNYTGTFTITRYLAQEYNLPFYKFKDILEEVEFTQKQCWYKSTLRNQTKFFITIFKEKKELDMIYKMLNIMLSLFEKNFLDLEDCRQMTQYFLQNRGNSAENQGLQLSNLIFYLCVFHEICSWMVMGFTFESKKKTKEFVRIMWEFDLALVKSCKTLNLMIQKNNDHFFEFLI